MSEWPSTMAQCTAQKRQIFMRNHRLHVSIATNKNVVTSSNGILFRSCLHRLHRSHVNINSKNPYFYWSLSFLRKGERARGVFAQQTSHVVPFNRFTSSHHKRIRSFFLHSQFFFICEFWCPVHIRCAQVYCAHSIKKPFEVSSFFLTRA